MRPVLRKIIGIGIRQRLRIDAQERIMCKEQGSAIRLAQRQCDTGICIAIGNTAIFCPAIVVNYFGNRMRWRRSRHHIGDQAFIPSTYLVVHIPGKVGAPMPVQYIFIVLAKPTPFNGLPQCIDIIAQSGFIGIGQVEILPCRIIRPSGKKFPPGRRHHLLH